MFRRFYIDNFRCLVNFDMPLQEMTLLLGRNGTGKTSLLDVAYALRELLSGRAKISDPSIFPSRTLTGWQSSNIQVFEVEVGIEDDILVYRIEIEQDIANDRARISRERLLSKDGRPLFRFEHGDVHLFRDDHSEGPVYSAGWTGDRRATMPPYSCRRGTSRHGLPISMERTWKKVVPPIRVSTGPGSVSGM